MSAQPTSGYQWKAVSGGVGTAVVSDKDTVLRSIFIPGTYVGTINFHDAAAAVGTNTTSQIIQLGLPTTTFPATPLELNVQCKKGLLYQATGTPLVTFTWGD